MKRPTQLQIDISRSWLEANEIPIAERAACMAVSDWLAHEADAIRSAKLSLVAAIVGSCTCSTKTPNIAYHHADCRYLKIASALEALDE